MLHSCLTRCHALPRSSCSPPHFFLHRARAKQKMQLTLVASWEKAANHQTFGMRRGKERIQRAAFGTTPFFSFFRVELASPRLFNKKGLFHSISYCPYS